VTLAKSNSPMEFKLHRSEWARKINTVYAKGDQQEKNITRSAICVCHLKLLPQFGIQRGEIFHTDSSV